MNVRSPRPSIPFRQTTHSGGDIQIQYDEFIRIGQDINPVCFGGGDFGYGLNKGIIDASKQVPSLLFEEITIPYLIKNAGLLKVSMKYNQFSTFTKGQFTGTSHQFSRGAFYQEYKASILLFNERFIKTTQTTFSTFQNTSSIVLSVVNETTK